MNRQNQIQKVKLSIAKNDAAIKLISIQLAQMQYNQIARMAELRFQEMMLERDAKLEAAQSPKPTA